MFDTFFVYVSETWYVYYSSLMHPCLFLDVSDYVYEICMLFDFDASLFVFGCIRLYDMFFISILQSLSEK